MWTRPSHFASIVAHAIMALLATSMLAKAQTDQQACPDPAQIVTGKQAFETFCGRCHLAEKLTAGFADSSDPAKAEADMAAFLDGHGPCPHDRHDAIAAYLRQVSGS